MFFHSVEAGGSNLNHFRGFALNKENDHLRKAMRMEKRVFYNLPFISSFVFSTCFVNLTELEDAAENLFIKSSGGE